MEKQQNSGFFDKFFGKKDQSVEPPTQKNVNLHTELENDGSFVNYTVDGGVVGLSLIHI